MKKTVILLCLGIISIQANNSNQTKSGSNSSIEKQLNTHLQAISTALKNIYNQNKKDWDEFSQEYYKLLPEIQKILQEMGNESGLYKTDAQTLKSTQISDINNIICNAVQYSTDHTWKKEDLNKLYNLSKLQTFGQLIVMFEKVGIAQFLKNLAQGNNQVLEENKSKTSYKIIESTSPLNLDTPQYNLLGEKINNDKSIKNLITKLYSNYYSKITPSFCKDNEFVNAINNAIYFIGCKLSEKNQNQIEDMNPDETLLILLGIFEELDIFSFCKQTPKPPNNFTKSYCNQLESLIQ